MFKYKNMKKYKALGFVESMIAIMVLGMSSVVLMQIAVNVMQDILQNEAIDKLTQHAIEGAEIVQDIANRNKEVGGGIFPLSAEYESDPLGRNCFRFKLEGESIVFAKDDEDNWIKYTSDERDSYKNEAILNDEDELFRLICFNTPMGGVAGEPAFVTTEIIVGQRHGDGAITKGNLAKDYVYATIVKL
jgi:type II secretory pathway pseudopilin PulG